MNERLDQLKSEIDRIVSHDLNEAKTEADLIGGTDNIAVAITIAADAERILSFAAEGGEAQLANFRENRIPQLRALPIKRDAKLLRLISAMCVVAEAQLSGRAAPTNAQLGIDWIATHESAQGPHGAVPTACRTHDEQKKWWQFWR